MKQPFIDCQPPSFQNFHPRRQLYFFTVLHRTRMRTDDATEDQLLRFIFQNSCSYSTLTPLARAYRRHEWKSVSGLKRARNKAKASNAKRNSYHFLTSTDALFLKTNHIWKLLLKKLLLFYNMLKKIKVFSALHN